MKMLQMRDILRVTICHFSSFNSSKYKRVYITVLLQGVCGLVRDTYLVAISLTFTSVRLTAGLLSCGVGLICSSRTVKFVITHFSHWYTYC